MPDISVLLRILGAAAGPFAHGVNAGTVRCAMWVSEAFVSECRVAAKIHQMRRTFMSKQVRSKRSRLLAGSVSAFLIFGVAACAAEESPEAAPSTAPADEATETPEPEATPEEEPEVAPGFVVGDPAGFTTDTILLGPKEGTGLNERVTLVAGDQSGLLDGVQVQEGTKTASKKEIAAAQQLAAEFLIEVITDSSILHDEDPAVLKAWYADFRKSKLLSKSLVAEIDETDDPAKDFYIPNGGVLTIEYEGKAYTSRPDPSRPTKNGTYYDDVSVVVDEAFQSEADNLVMDYVVFTRRAVLFPTVEGEELVTDQHQKIIAKVVVDWAKGKPKVKFWHTELKTYTDEPGNEPVFEE